MGQEAAPAPAPSADAVSPGWSQLLSAGSQEAQDWWARYLETCERNGRIAAEQSAGIRQGAGREQAGARPENAGSAEAQGELLTDSESSGPPGLEDSDNDSTGPPPPLVTSSEEGGRQEAEAGDSDSSGGIMAAFEEMARRQQISQRIPNAEIQEELLRQQEEFKEDAERRHRITVSLPAPMTPQSQANDSAFNDRFRQLFAPLFAERQGRQGLQAEELTGAPRQAGELTGAPRSQGPDWPNPGWLYSAPRQPGTLRASSLPASQPASHGRCEPFSKRSSDRSTTTCRRARRTSTSHWLSFPGPAERIMQSFPGTD